MAANKSNGDFFIIDTLRQWGITCFAGVNGGGLAHLARYLEPITAPTSLNVDIPKMLSLSEYSAGFMPLGYYLASGRIAGCIATTGAAIKLVGAGMSDAKLQNIPAIYLVALNPSFANHLAPLQDVSSDGMNIIAQLRAEFGTNCIVVDDIHHLSSQLAIAQQLLNQSQPVILLFYPDVLVQSTPFRSIAYSPAVAVPADLNKFLKKIQHYDKDKRIILYVCSEAARTPHIQSLTTALSVALQAPTVWSVNGANAVAENNPYGYGYISFGGNDRALALWKSMNKEDVLITLGFDPGEYALGLEKLPAGEVWHFTNFPKAYGHLKGTVKHRVKGRYNQLIGDISAALTKLIPQLSVRKNLSKPPQFASLNTRELAQSVSSGCVDLYDFYQCLHTLWQPNSIGFDDVCVAYKDRQYITQRPHPNIQFHTLDQGSAMGGAFGLGIGAKLADPQRHVFIFTGDGCWRLFAGALAEAVNFDLRLFVLDNHSYALVEKGLSQIIPDVDKKHYHGTLTGIDFVAAAKAYGWLAVALKPDLSNLTEIIDLCYLQQGKSMLIHVPVDGDQVIGINNRLENLKFKNRD